MAAKGPQVIQQYITGGDRSLRDWHLLLRRVTFGAALVLMSASIVSLHWACNLIGLAGPWEPVAWLVPLAMEFGMAAVASTATTIRKDTGGYYLSLWVIFSFVMLLAQASNIGHALVTVAENTADLPPVIPPTVIYAFACAFAALFPLGGTLFVHVSGFLRVHGTGARWIDADAELVQVQVAPGAATPAAPAATRAPARTRSTPTAPAAPAARADSPEPARAEAAPRAQTPPAPTRADARAADKQDDKARARALFDAAVTADPLTRPNAKQIHTDLATDRDPATVRTWVKGWWDQHEQAMAGHQPAADNTAA